MASNGDVDMALDDIVSSCYTPLCVGSPYWLGLAASIHGCCK